MQSNDIHIYTMFIGSIQYVSLSDIQSGKVKLPNNINKGDENLIEGLIKEQ